MSKKDLGKIFLFSKNYDFSQIEDGTGARYSNGSDYYEGNDGTRIQIYSNGSGYYENSNGDIENYYEEDEYQEDNSAFNNNSITE